MSNPDFEAYWALTGARYSTGDHKERARHAYEAGARSAAPRDAGRAEWLDVIGEIKPDMDPLSIPCPCGAKEGEPCRSEPPRPSPHPSRPSACPVCGAKPGERCVSLSCAKFMHTPHPARGDQS